MSRRPPTKRGPRTLAEWLALRLGCTEVEAEARLRASHRAAWRMSASADELAVDEATEATS